MARDVGGCGYGSGCEFGLGEAEFETVEELREGDGGGVEEVGVELGELVAGLRGEGGRWGLYLFC